MKCPSCNREIDRDSRFCVYCGINIVDAHIQNLIDRGEILEAIKCYKDTKYVTLKEAKDYILKIALGVKTVKTPQRPSTNYHFRNVKDVKNIIPYSTLNVRENHLFFSYLYMNFSDCQIETQVSAKQIFPQAPDYAMPINFLLTKGNNRIAVLLVEGNAKYKRYSVLETMELCKENDITPLRFITTYPNEEAYVVKRIKAILG